MAYNAVYPLKDISDMADSERIIASIEHHIDVIRQSGKLSHHTVLSLETLKPGIVFDTIGTTPLSQISNEDVSNMVANLSRYKHLLAAGVIGAVIGFILKIVFGGDKKEREEKSDPEKVKKNNEEVSNATKELHEACDKAKANTHSNNNQLAEEKRNHIKSKIMHLTGKDEDAVRGIVSSDSEIKSYLFSNPSKLIHDLLMHSLKDKLPVCIIDSAGIANQKDLAKLIDTIDGTAKDRVDTMSTVTNAYMTGTNVHQPGMHLSGELVLPEEYLPEIYHKDTDAIIAFTGSPSGITIPELIKAFNDKVRGLVQFVEDKKVQEINEPDKLIHRYTNEMILAQSQAVKYIATYEPIIKPLISKIDEFTKQSDEIFVQGKRSGRKFNDDEKKRKHAQIHKHLIEQLKLTASILACMESVSVNFNLLNTRLDTLRKNLLEAKDLVTYTETAFLHQGK